MSDTQYISIHLIRTMLLRVKIDPRSTNHHGKPNTIHSDRFMKLRRILQTHAS